MAKHAVSQNDYTFKNLAANATRYLKCFWLMWDIMHYWIKTKAYNIFWPDCLVCNGKHGREGNENYIL